MGRCAICARAGRWRKRASLTGRACSHRAIRTRWTIARCSPSGRCLCSRKTVLSFSNPEPSCFTSANGARPSCQRRWVRARATQWLIAALNSIEPHLMNVAVLDLFYANEEWAKLRRPGAVEFAQKRLAALSNSLGAKPYLDGDRFTAGDLMMPTVLRILKHTDIATSDRRLADYIERCTARAAFKRAFDAQIAD